ncbi:MAG: DUF2934 domain-containing protein [Alphaproteobacteria bacterium]|nr:DUF2934 domain-containing protein [Alphaproteobacteria bacterium]
MGMELIERIRERAYQLWEAEGCAHGRDMEYWFRAEADVSSEASEPDNGSNQASRGKSARTDAESDVKPATSKPAKAKKS